MAQSSQLEYAGSTETTDECSAWAMSPAHTQLTVKDVMTANVLTASPTEEILPVARRMCIYHVSCIVVAEDDAVVGVFTQRDLLGGIARQEKDYCRLPVAKRMSHPVVVAAPDLPVLEAGRILKSRCIKHLPIVADGRLVGIVSQTDITRGLVYLMPLQSVSQVMSPHVATLSVEATAADAARLMWSQRISCVVVMHRSEAVGVVSQRDIVTRVLWPRKDPRHTPLADVMTLPVLPVPPDYSVFTASRMMEKMHIHRLVVQDVKRVCGIISQTDILQAVEERLAEEERHRLLLMHSDIPLFILDAHGTITYVNSAFLNLLEARPHDKIVGCVLSDERFWDNPDDRVRLIEILSNGQSTQLELALSTRTGGTRRIILLLATARNTCDAATGWQGVAWPVVHRESSARLACHSSADISSEA